MNVQIGCLYAFDSELLTKLENAIENNEIDPEFYALALQAVKQGLIDGDTAKVRMSQTD